MRILFPILLLISTCAFGQTVYVEDTFTDTNGTALTSHTPDTDTVGSGWVLKRGDGPTIQGNVLTDLVATSVVEVVAIDTGQTNGEVSVDIVVGTGGTNAVPGLILRTTNATGAANIVGYIAWLNRSTDELVLSRYESETATPLDTASVTIDAGDAVTLTATMLGDSITVVATGDVSATVSASDSTYSANGYHGIYAIDNGSTTANTFDNFLMQAADAVTISSPVQYQIFQRASGAANIAITGTYAGTPTAIEASFNGGDYATIDASPSGGSYSGTLSNQAQGQGTLAVRFTNDTGVSASVSTIGIGDVFLIVGQSNGAGVGTNNQSYSHASLTASMFQETGSWQELADPTDVDADGGSIWPLIATMHMADQGVPVGFLTQAESATGLVVPDDNWDPDGTDNYYDAAITRVGESGVNDLAAIIWVQGERDAKNGIATATYNAALDALITAFQTDLSISAPMVCYLLGNMQLTHTPAGGTADIDKIRFAQIQAWDDNASIYPGPCMIDVDLSDESGDGIHYKTDAELATFAARMWAAIDAAIFDGTAGRGPRLRWAAYDDDTITLAFDKSLTADATLTTSTFAVTDDGGAVTLTAAAASGGTVTLTADAALVPPVSVSYGLGNSGAGADLILGADANQLVAEPFSGVTANAFSGSQPFGLFSGAPGLIWYKD